MNLIRRAFGTTVTYAWMLRQLAMGSRSIVSNLGYAEETFEKWEPTRLRIHTDAYAWLN